MMVAVTGRRKGAEALGSSRAIVEKRVVLGADGAYVENVTSGARTHSCVENSVYVLRLWVKRPAVLRWMMTSGFR